MLVREVISAYMATNTNADWARLALLTGTVGEALTLYFTHHLAHCATFRDRQRVVRQHFGLWQDRLLNSIKRRDLVLWQAQLRATPTTANKCISIMCAVYNWLIRMELYAGINPAREIPPVRTYSRERFLTIQETETLLEGLATTASLRLRALVVMTLLTGARPGEVRTMKWANVDLESRRWYKPRTKSGRPQWASVPQQAIEVLRALLPSTSEWVFPGEAHGPWQGDSTRKAWKAFRRKVGLPPDVWLYDLRRTCASYLAIHGENLPTIQNVLNHTSLQHTSIYARMNMTAVDRALQAQADRIFSLVQRHPMEMLEPPHPHHTGQ